MTIRNQKRPEPRYFAIPHDTMVIVDSSTPGNLAHEPNNTPETLGDAIKRDAFRGINSGSSQFHIKRIADPAAFEAAHGVRLLYNDIRVDGRNRPVVEICRDDA